MLGFHEKRRLQSFLYSRYVLAFLCIPVAFMWYAAHNALTNERESAAQKHALEETLSSLNIRAAALEADIAHLDDPYGKEQELRRRYDVGKEGEQAIIFVEEDGLYDAPPPLSPEKPTWWERVKAWF